MNRYTTFMKTCLLKEPGKNQPEKMKKCAKKYRDGEGE